MAKRSPVQKVYAAKCIKCESAKLKVVKKIREQDYAGVHEGKTYKKVIFRRVKCLECGQFQIVKEYK